MSSNKNSKKISKRDDDNSSCDSRKKTHHKKRNDSDSEESSSDEEEDSDLDEWETDSGNEDSEYETGEDNITDSTIDDDSDESTLGSKPVSRKKKSKTNEYLYANHPSRYYIKNKVDDKDKYKNKDKKKGKKRSKKQEVSEDSSDSSEFDSESDDAPKKRRNKGKSEIKDRTKKRKASSMNEDTTEESKNYSIILAALGGDDGPDEEVEMEEMLNDKNEECGSDDEKTFMKESYTQIALPSAVDIHESIKDKTKKKRPKSSVKQDVEEEYLDLVDLKKDLAIKLEKKPENKIILRAYKDCKEAINKFIKSNRTDNAKDYYKLIRSEEENEGTCEIKYFKTKLSHKEQVKVITDLKLVNEHIRIDRPYRIMLLQSKMPIKYKATVMQKLNTMYNMEPSDPEYYKSKAWIDAFMRVPFDIYRSLSVKLDDGIDVCSAYMKHAKGILDDSVYGLEDAKLQTLQMIGQWITNPAAMGSTIAIHGPMGTGKTSIVKEGISKILGREFAFIALGGGGDASFLEGHSYTYEGSLWGKIVQILMDCKCMNPVIYFDELDKVSDTPRGQEIISVLTHLTDTTQNSQFHDKYFSEIDFDLSKCLFIFSYNDESKVNAILKDRMYRIQTKGYDTKEKLIIATKYLLPKIREQVNFHEDDVVIPDETISYIISDARFTQNEQGVRNLKRCLEVIHTKLNLFRLLNDDDSLNILGKHLDLKVNFPFTVTKKVVDTLIKNEETLNPSLLAMYV